MNPLLYKTIMHTRLLVLLLFLFPLLAGAASTPIYKGLLQGDLNGGGTNRITNIFQVILTDGTVLGGGTSATSSASFTNMSSASPTLVSVSNTLNGIYGWVTLTPNNLTNIGNFMLTNSILSELLLSANNKTNLGVWLIANGFGGTGAVNVAVFTNFSSSSTNYISVTNTSGGVKGSVYFTASNLSCLAIGLASNGLLYGVPTTLLTNNGPNFMVGTQTIGAIHLPAGVTTNWTVGGGSIFSAATNSVDVTGVGGNWTTAVQPNYLLRTTNGVIIGTVSNVLNNGYLTLMAYSTTNLSSVGYSVGVVTTNIGTIRFSDGTVMNSASSGAHFTNLVTDTPLYLSVTNSSGGTNATISITAVNLTNMVAFMGTNGLLLSGDWTSWLSTNTYVKTESDPTFSSWLGTNTYVKSESDPVFNSWLGTNTYIATAANTATQAVSAWADGKFGVVSLAAGPNIVLGNTSGTWTITSTGGGDVFLASNNLFTAAQYMPSLVMTSTYTGGIVYTNWYPTESFAAYNATLTNIINRQSGTGFLTALTNGMIVAFWENGTQVINTTAVLSIESDDAATMNSFFEMPATTAISNYVETVGLSTNLATFALNGGTQTVAFLNTPDQLNSIFGYTPIAGVIGGTANVTTSTNANVVTVNVATQSFAGVAYTNQANLFMDGQLFGWFKGSALTLTGTFGYVTGPTGVRYTNELNMISGVQPSPGWGMFSILTATNWPGLFYPMRVVEARSPTTNVFVNQFSVRDLNDNVMASFGTLGAVFWNNGVAQTQTMAGVTNAVSTTGAQSFAVTQGMLYLTGTNFTLANFAPTTASLILTNNGSGYTIGVVDATSSNQPASYGQVLSLAGGQSSFYLRGSNAPYNSGFQAAAIQAPTSNWSFTITATNGGYPIAWMLPTNVVALVKQGAANITGVGLALVTAASGRSATVKWELYATNTTGGAMPEWSDAGSTKVVASTTPDSAAMSVAINNATNLTSTEGIVVRMKVTGTTGSSPQLVITGGSNLLSQVSIPTGIGTLVTQVGDYLDIPSTAQTGNPASGYSRLYGATVNGQEAQYIKQPSGDFIRLGRDTQFTFCNQDTNTLNRGDWVCFITNAINGTSHYIKKANASDPTRMPAVGVVTEASIASNAFGSVLFIGRTDTNMDTSAFAASQPLYISWTDDGRVTNAPAPAPNISQFVGWANKIHASAGAFSVRTYQPLTVNAVTNTTIAGFGVNNGTLTGAVTYTSITNALSGAPTWKLYIPMTVVATNSFSLNVPLLITNAVAWRFHFHNAHSVTNGVSGLDYLRAQYNSMTTNYEHKLLESSSGSISTGSTTNSYANYLVAMPSDDTAYEKVGKSTFTIWNPVTATAKAVIDVDMECDNFAGSGTWLYKAWGTEHSPPSVGAVTNVFFFPSKGGGTLIRSNTFYMVEVLLP